MDAVEAYVDAAAAVLGLPLAAEHRPGVVRYVELAAGFAERVMDFPLDVAVEGANVFVAVEVRE
jgi:uncharacterized protein YaaQ